jgi:hypothetical protein
LRWLLLPPLLLSGAPLILFSACAGRGDDGQAGRQEVAAQARRTAQAERAARRYSARARGSARTKEGSRKSPHKRQQLRWSSAGAGRRGAHRQTGSAHSALRRQWGVWERARTGRGGATWRVRRRWRWRAEQSVADGSTREGGERAHGK